MYDESDGQGEDDGRRDARAMARRSGGKGRREGKGEGRRERGNGRRVCMKQKRSICQAKHPHTHRGRSTELRKRSGRTSGMRKIIAEIRDEASRMFPAGAAASASASESESTSESGMLTSSSQSKSPLVVLLSRQGCRHCKRAQSALKSAAIPFEELSLSIATKSIYANSTESEYASEARKGVYDEGELFKLVENETGMRRTAEVSDFTHLTFLCLYIVCTTLR